MNAALASILLAIWLQEQKSLPYSEVARHGMLGILKIAHVYQYLLNPTTQRKRAGGGEIIVTVTMTMTAAPALIDPIEQGGGLPRLLSIPLLWIHRIIVFALPHYNTTLYAVQNSIAGHRHRGN